MSKVTFTLPPDSENSAIYTELKKSTGNSAIYTILRKLVIIGGKLIF